jgi:hypothetical protein
MPDYPDAAPAIQTDIILYSSDLAAYLETGLVVRSIFEPATQTMKVQVLAQTVPTPRVIAERIIFTAAPETPVMSPEEAEARFRKVPG